MTLWEIGKLREGWVSANTSKKDDKAAGYASEEEFEAIMAMEINEAEDTEGSITDFMESEKARR